MVATLAIPSAPSTAMDAPLITLEIRSLPGMSELIKLNIVLCVFVVGYYSCLVDACLVDAPSLLTDPTPPVTDVGDRNADIKHYHPHQNI